MTTYHRQFEAAATVRIRKESEKAIALISSIRRDALDILHSHSEPEQHISKILPNSVKKQITEAR